MFRKLPELSESERYVQREYMLRYCNLDTLALIYVLQKLYEAIDDPQAEVIKLACEEYLEEQKRRYAEEDEYIKSISG